MFGEPVPMTKKNAVFNLVWTYVIKLDDGRKKARMTCDGSPRSGQVRVLDHVYANALDQTGSKIFYALAAAENLLVFGADVSNAFGDAPPPKQGFFIRPDQAFRDWWVAKGNAPIPDGYVIPVLAALQGHPESPRLWEKHIDKILRKLGFVPTVHEPCLYRGEIEGIRVLFKRQVDDFALAAPNSDIANKTWDLIDAHLKIPMKRYGLISMYNGLDILQSRWFVKVSIKTWLTKMMQLHTSKTGLTFQPRHFQHHLAPASHSSSVCTPLKATQIDGLAASLPASTNLSVMVVSSISRLSLTNSHVRSSWHKMTGQNGTHRNFYSWTNTKSNICLVSQCP
jgi:hypothetical protein